MLSLGSVRIDHVDHVERFDAPGETRASTTLTRGTGGKGFNRAATIGVTRHGAAASIPFAHELSHF